MAVAPRPEAAASAVLAFDATARRRARNRSGGALPQSAAKPASPPATPAPQGAHGSNGANGHAHGNGHHAPAVQAVVVEPVPVPAPAPRSTPHLGVNRLASIPSAVSSAPAAAAPAAAALEADLVDFVVEQTGYPREIVELDADLEGDLGIDSIRKAQLFGEIGQKYGLSADASVSLDDFRSLRHLLDYMAPRVGARPSARTEQPATATGSASASNGHAGSNGHSSPSRPVARVEAPVASGVSAAAAIAAPPGGTTPAEQIGRAHV